MNQHLKTISNFSAKGPLFPPQYEETNKGHGRVETRRIWTTTELNDYLKFPYVAQAFRIEREVFHFKSGKTTIQIAYGITSCSPSKAAPQKLLELNRGQWTIENRLHYIRDVSFREDHSQIRTGNGPRVMATLRNIAIGLLNKLGFSGGKIRSGLRRMGWMSEQVPVLFGR